MCDFESHQSNIRDTCGVFADTLENKIAIHLSQLVLIAPLLATTWELSGSSCKWSNEAFGYH